MHTRQGRPQEAGAQALIQQAETARFSTESPRNSGVRCGPALKLRCGDGALQQRQTAKTCCSRCCSARKLALHRSGCRSFVFEAIDEIRRISQGDLTSVLVRHDDLVAALGRLRGQHP